MAYKSNVMTFHAHMEYERALVVQRMLKNKKYMSGLSENETKEHKELNARIYKYRKDSLLKKIK